MNLRPLILLIALVHGVAAAQVAPETTAGIGDPATKMHDSATVPDAAPFASNASQPDATSPVVAMQGVAAAASDRDTGLPGSEPDRLQVVKPDIPNPAIDMNAYLRVSNEAAEHRQSHRVSEEDFLRMSREPGTIVLDARSAEKYRLLHVRGAINLSFPDITIDSLKQAIPDKTTRILIYCNNNFSGAEKPFPSKLPSASLNLSTYIALYSYGYENVYELGPLVDLKLSKLPFEGIE